ncbi:hypothetical protein D8674_003595 [Pyrus ussuriensis x Pyrus communis]|uniref:NmrA-like domain-containing protein n=1 Tax=Pyrus ussuriensis x Pyrus communis TaxID=2448454 RepID=A0A5N5FMT1_9ROSA|nr:hypothetical protein D8674_003595 [Pyrus ussuriensis x Pyrus communis]
MLLFVDLSLNCAVGRPEDPIKKVDWEGKVALIQCAKAMGIQKFVFYSIHNCDKHPEVPLMEIKYCTEKFLQDTCINHVIIRLCGFMQAYLYVLFSGNYWTVCSIAVPILEESVWGTDAPTRIAYMDTQFNHALTDVAPLTFIGLRNEKVNGKLVTFAGPCAWTTQEVITLCERFAGQEVNITRVPVSVLRVTRQLARLFECRNDVADRLAFSEDVALLTFIGLRNVKVNGKLVTFAGPHAWTTQEVITLCERFAGQEANITRVPVSVLRVTRQLTRLFECTNDVADRLAFSEEFQ